MSEDVISRAEEILEHSGVKGMKWGQRRSHFEAQQKAKADKKDEKSRQKDWKKKVKSEKKWAVDAKDPKALIAVHNKAANQYNAIDVPRINNKKEYRNHDMRQVDHPLTKKYFKEHEDAFNKRRDEALDSIVGKSALGLSLRIRPDGTTYFTEIKHVDQPTGIIVKFDESGRIVKFIVTEESMEQSEFSDKGEDFINHSGVKGMKWGVRRASRKSPTVVKIGSRLDSSKRPDNLGINGKKTGPGVRTHPGKIRPGARKYDPKTLSNADLKKVVERMKLESEYAKLNEKNKSRGQKFVDNLLEEVPKMVINAAMGEVKKGIKTKMSGDDSDDSGGSGKKGKGKKNKNKTPALIVP